MVLKGAYGCGLWKTAQLPSIHRVSVEVIQECYVQADLAEGDVPTGIGPLVKYGLCRTALRVILTFLSRFGIERSEGGNTRLCCRSNQGLGVVHWSRSLSMTFTHAWHSVVFHQGHYADVLRASAHSQETSHDVTCECVVQRRETGACNEGGG